MPAAEPPPATRWCAPATSAPSSASPEPHQPVRPSRSPSTGPDDTATSAGDEAEHERAQARGHAEGDAP